MFNSYTMIGERVFTCINDNAQPYNGWANHKGQP